ncbi:hypothetical protein DC498_17700 [Terrimonas sp.]|nr:hypothetical protein DC498_17700 [Terrimonas sp.]
MTTPNKKIKKQHKDNSLPTEIILDFLRLRPATAAMVEQATRIRHCCICRYKRRLQKDNKLWELFKAPCKRTGYSAWYLTTNPAIAKSLKERRNG